MSESDLGLVPLLDDIKNNFCAIPLGFVFNKRQVAVQNEPTEFFARN